MADEKQKKAKPVTFRDPVFVQRKILIGEDVLLLKDGQITVTDPAHIEALAKDRTLERV